MIWMQPPPTLTLVEDTVHVWKCNLEDISNQYDVCYKLLNHEERERAHRYRFDKPRVRFVLTRALLRQLISLYVRRAPDLLSFNMNEWGKPALLGHIGSHLEFNIAHSKDLALLAFSNNRPVGIDVEFIHSIENIDRLVKNFFSDNEVKKFIEIPIEMQRLAFFTGWTRKEAYIKARGKGLSIPLNSFDVTLMPSEAAALLADRTDAEAIYAWTLMDIQTEGDYVATLAVAKGTEKLDVVGYNFNMATWMSR